MAQLSQPSIVTIHDAGTAGAQVWIAMEFVIGRTLANWHKESRRGWREVLPAFLQAGQGLCIAHAAGLVHCDYKPHPTAS